MSPTIRQAFWRWFKKTKALYWHNDSLQESLRRSTDLETAYRAGFREAQRRYLTPDAPAKGRP
jgi:hypothetical protein